MKETTQVLQEYGTANSVSAEVLVAALERFVDATGYKPKVFGHDINFTGQARSVLDIHAIETFNFMGAANRRVEILPGINAVWGPNGSGKSRLLRALLYALRSYAAAGASSHAKLISAGETKMFADVTFTKGHVRRGAKARTIARGAEAGTVKVEEDVLVEVEGDQSDKPKEAQATLEHWVGVDLEFVLRSCFVRQGEATRLLDEEPSARRAVVYKLMSLDVCEDAATRIRKWLSELETEAAKSAGTLAECEASLAQLVKQRNQIPVEQLKAKLAVIEAQPVKPSNAAKIADLKSRLSLLATRTQETLDRAKRKSQLTDKLNELRKDPVLAKSFGEVGPKLTFVKSEKEKAANHYSRLATMLEGITAKGKALKTLPAECETCAAIGKVCELTPEMKEAKRQELLAQHKTLSANIKSADEALRAAILDLEVVDAEAATLERERGQKEFITKQIEMLESTIATMGPAFEEHATAQQALDLANNELLALQKVDAPEEPDYRPVIAKELASAASLDEQIKAATKRADKAKAPEPLDGPRALAKAFAKDGIPLMLARKHIGAINRLAEELAEGDAFRYAFNEDLAVVITDPNNLEVEPKLVCGSARERGALVMAAALCRYMQNLAQLSVGTIWVDEIPFQDEANTQHVVSLLRSLQKWYPKVVFGVCQFEPYQGKFDHEIALTPTVSERALTEVKAPAVKTYHPVNGAGSETEDSQDRIAAAAAVDDSDLPF